MDKRYTGYAYVKTGPCCGTAEINTFTVRIWENWRGEPYAQYRADLLHSAARPGQRWVVTPELAETPEEAAKMLLKEALTCRPKPYRRATQFAYYIWFRKFRKKDPYEYEALHKVVKEYPGVIDLGEIKNPNTNHYLHGYLIKE